MIKLVFNVILEKANISDKFHELKQFLNVKNHGSMLHMHAIANCRLPSRLMDKGLFFTIIMSCPKALI